MIKGVVLVSFGKRGYAYSAYNFAFSIKRHDPDIPIIVFTDGNIHNELTDWQKNIFDDIIYLPERFRNEAGKLDPCTVKTSIYDLLPFDYNLFLDVDALALHSLEKIFEECIGGGGYYYTKVNGKHKLSDGEKVAPMGWAYMEDIFNKYKLSNDAVIQNINTSFQFIKKCDEAKELFDQIKRNLSDGIPLSELKYQWGGGQPDELYTTIALTQKNVEAATLSDYLFMANTQPQSTLTDIAELWPILCLWGGKNMARPMFTEWYDRMLIKWHSEKGLRHIYKWNFIKSDKHANIKPVAVKSNTSTLRPALIPISESKLIDSKKLIQSYPDSNKQTVRVTNWLNCSAIQFKGKKYFVYRMESRPFCTRMKIGMCLLNDSYDAIEGSNVLLELYSDLKHAILQGGKSFPKGFHVEDPRLFIFNDELFISYTDGYQMGLGKINTDIMQVSESYYIDKPTAGRTEKNWTFFESGGELYSVYEICPHVIFKIAGGGFEKVASVPYDLAWDYGIPRGGTCPVRYGDNFISFFHSSISITHKGVAGKQYFVGAYLFESEFPFTPVAMTKEPLIAGEVIDALIPRLSNRIYVVFPGGQIRKDKSFEVTFGYNDYQCRVVTITDEMIEKNLIKIESKILQA
jgi:predicted GH43/DUF377 family glycosyl hydrolase